MFDTLLIANRGEIACRVIRTARAMGLRTVAVYSDADADALHVRQADLAVRIGAPPARSSYLNVAAIVAACRTSGAGAVHPGYGFLSENADFARALREAGITFVGPTPESIDALGNKSAAKRLAQRIEVPCLPGYSGTDQAIDTLLAQARSIGAPLMIKAAAGGGGRGMRRCDDVTDPQAVRALLEAARTEAAGAFGNGDLLLERLVERARHVEIQVFGDSRGGCVHLGERDCTTQRRNQKILEEAPAPGVDPALRARMGEAAVRLAREVGYVGAGTVEFLLAPDGEYYFLEMNTRLQVEHPVTEAVTGLDLVEWQLRVARGEPLPLEQSQICWQGHAIEARLCAEDAWAGFVPQVGRIVGWQPPQGEGIRVDHGLGEAPQVSPYYDSMIAKVIASGPDREAARARLVAALRDTAVFGVGTNRDYLLSCLQARPFVAADLATAWLGESSGQWSRPSPDSRWLALAAALRLARQARRHGPLAAFSSGGRRSSVMPLEVDGTQAIVRVEYGTGAPATVTVTDTTHVVDVGVDAAPTRATIDGLQVAVRASLDDAGGWLDAFGVTARFMDRSDAPARRSERDGGGTVTARMHGQVVKLAVQAGQSVTRGTFLLSLEAMKMEHRIEAPLAGTIVEIAVAPGTQVTPGRLLVRIEPTATPG